MLCRESQFCEITWRGEHVIDRAHAEGDKSGVTLARGCAAVWSVCLTGSVLLLPTPMPLLLLLV
jgi:hypothetical protein